MQVVFFLVFIIKFEIRPRRHLKYNGKSVSNIEKCSENFKMKDKRKIRAAEMENTYMSPYVAVKYVSNP